MVSSFGPLTGTERTVRVDQSLKTVKECLPRWGSDLLGVPLSEEGMGGGSGLQ